MNKKGILVLLVATILVSSLSATAQKNSLRLGIGANIGSTLKNTDRVAAGIDVRLQAPLGNSISGILTTGYYQFFKNNKYVGLSIIPIKAGLKYFPIKNVYIAGEAGVGLITSKIFPSSFVYSPSAGVAFANGLDVSLKFENYTKYNGYASQLAIRFAYGFKL